MAWKVKSHGFLSKTNAEVFGSSILSLYSDLTSWLSEPFFDTFKFLLIIKQKYGFFIDRNPNDETLKALQSSF